MTACMVSPIRTSDDSRVVGALGRPFAISDLAALFQCSSETVKRWCRDGELPAQKMGKYWFVFEKHLEQHFAEGVHSKRHLRRIQEDQK